MGGGYPCCCVSSSSESSQSPTSLSSASTDSSASEAVLNCSICNAGRTPNTVKVTLAGILNERCSVCGNQNGTYYLFNSFANPCRWTIPIPIDCEGVCGFNVSPAILTLRFTITRTASDFNFSLALLHSTTTHFGWSRLIPHGGRLTLDCCEIENMNLVAGARPSASLCGGIGTPTWCNYDLSIANVTAINCGGPNVFL